MKIFNYILAAVLFFALIFYIGSKKNPYQIIQGKTMGTYYNIKIRVAYEDNLLNSEIKLVLDEIVTKSSVFEPNSEISQINKAAGDEWVELSPMMADLMKRAYSVYIKTNGVFDPTVGKLADLWGFGVSKISKTPTDEEIKQVLEYTGFNKVKFADDYTKLKKNNANIYINLSAIAKGYGVDKVVELLENKGYTDFVVEIGGEVRAKGEKSDEVPGWIIGISRPVKEKSENVYVVTLKNRAVATSGDYRNFHEMNGEVYSHTIDPKTGYPAKSFLSSVTVFADTCTEADALATAILAMGETKGLSFANNKKLQVVMFKRNESQEFDVLVSDRAAKLLNSD